MCCRRRWSSAGRAAAGNETSISIVVRRPGVAEAGHSGTNLLNEPLRDSPQDRRAIIVKGDEPMRHLESSRSITGLWLVALLLSACSGAAYSPTAVPLIVTAASSVAVTKDRPYTIPAQPTAHEWLLDVYAPSAAG